MTEFLDMSLDDIIKNNKKSSSGSHSTSRFRGRAGAASGAGVRSHGRSRGRGSDSGPVPGPTRRIDTRPATRTNPYFVPQVYIHTLRVSFFSFIYSRLTGFI